MNHALSSLLAARSSLGQDSPARPRRHVVAAVAAATLSAIAMAQVTGPTTPPTTPPIAPADAPAVQTTGVQAAPGGVAADDLTAPPPAGKWTFTLAPYLWVPASTGTVGIGGQTAPVNVTQGDAIDALSDFDGGLSLHAEARYEKFSLFADVMYFKLKSDATTAAGDPATLRFKEGFFEVGLAYRLLSTPLDEHRTVNLVVEPLAGVRLYYFEIGVDVPNSGESADPSTLWGDAFGGFRGSLSFFSDAVAVFGRADFGGGGSKFAWNAIVGLDVRITHWCSMVGGYRWLSIDRDDGSGEGRFEYDVRNEGPFIGAEFRF